MPDWSADEEPPRHARGGRGKDTRRWCRGRVGREHVLEIVIPENSYWRTCKWTRNWRTDNAYAWACSHVERCSVCHKVLRDTWWYGTRDPKRHLRPEECPLYTYRSPST